MPERSFDSAGISVHERVLRPNASLRPFDRAFHRTECRDLGDDPATTFLEVGRVALGSGPTFGAPGNGFARLNFATSPELVDEAVRRIAATVHR